MGWKRWTAERFSIVKSDILIIPFILIMDANHTWHDTHQCSYSKIPKDFIVKKVYWISHDAISGNTPVTGDVLIGEQSILVEPVDLTSGIADSLKESAIHDNYTNKIWDSGSVIHAYITNQVGTKEGHGLTCMIEYEYILYFN